MSPRNLWWCEAFVPALVATLCASMFEGGVAAVGVLRTGGGPAEAIVGLVSGAAIVYVAMLPLAFSIGWLASRDASSSMIDHMSKGLGGPDSGPGTALLMALIVIGLSFVAAVTGGRMLLLNMTPSFAIFGVAGISVFVLTGMLLIVPSLGRLIVGLVAGLSRFRIFTLIPGISFVILASSMILFAGITSILPGVWAAGPTGLVFGLFLFSLPVVKRHVNLRFSSFLARILVIIVFFASATLLFSLDALPGLVRSALLYQAPYTGTLLGAAQALIDRDDDGYSPFFLGGDCNDHNPRVRPDTRDIPGNRVDEDCTGADARLYRPVDKPAYSLSEALSDRPNVVLILLDALRPDHLSFFGYQRRTTPHLARFAKEAVVFERAYTPAPETQSAMVSLFTGLDVREAPVHRRYGKPFELDGAAVTLAERLKAVGYTTFGFTISYVIHHIGGMGQGFDLWRTPWPANEWRKIFGKAAKITTDAAVNTLSGLASDEPFLLFTHYRCNHDPYVKHKQWDYGNRPVDCYDSASSYCDQEVARFLDSLRSRPDWDRTAVFILSDHGELFGDHALTNHGNSLYEADVRILLMARIPGVEPRVVSTPVLLTDVASTVAEMAGAKSEDMSGWSLLTHLFAEGKIPHRPLYLFTDLRRGSIVRNASGVLSWPFKFIRDRRTRIEELYNVEEDPEEIRNLVSTNKKRAQSLRRDLEGFQSYLVRKQFEASRAGKI